MRPSKDISRLIEIMAALRTPGTGCPWDLEQDFSTIAPYTLEEAYEVADAIARGDLIDLRDELGDLLLQVAFHARMAEEQGAFSFGDVVEAITEKMIRRHPHVFGTVSVETAEAQTRAWEAHKEAERRARAAAEGRAPSALDGVAGGLPALTRAVKLQKRAARVGFDWRSAEEVLAKIEEEIAEVRAELQSGGGRERLSAELGDLLFAVVNLARHLEIDPETALRHANAKFERRFRGVEERLAASDRPVGQASLDEMDDAWTAIKHSEREK
jgi:ATP diphosphatase